MFSLNPDLPNLHQASQTASVSSSSVNNDKEKNITNKNKRRRTCNTPNTSLSESDLRFTPNIEFMSFPLQHQPEVLPEATHIPEGAKLGFDAHSDHSEHFNSSSLVSSDASTAIQDILTKREEIEIKQRELIKKLYLLRTEMEQGITEYYANQRLIEAFNIQESSLPTQLISLNMQPVLSDCTSTLSRFNQQFEESTDLSQDFFLTTPVSSDVPLQNERPLIFSNFSQVNGLRHSQIANNETLLSLPENPDFGISSLKND